MDKQGRTQVEIVEFAIRKRNTYETNAAEFPFAAHIILKDGGSSFKPDIRLELTSEIATAILSIVNPIAARAFNKAAQEFEASVTHGLTVADAPRLTPPDGE